ncbi:MAG: alpha/beta fold hydrolase [Gemmatimonadales bacterium]
MKTALVALCLAGCVLGSQTVACQRAPNVSRASAAPRVDTATITVNGAPLYYESAGTGPVVVLIHGGNLDSRMWDPQFLAFAREHRVIRYDVRGFGRSGPADAPWQAHEDLYALLGALKVDRTSLVGLSLGGRIAIDFALAHPSMVDRLVLAAPGLSGWKFANRDTSWYGDVRPALDRGDFAGVAEAWLKSDYMRPAMEHPELAPRLRELARANAPYWKGAFQHGDSERVAVPPALHRTGMLRARTLLVVGTRDNSDIMGIADSLSATVPGIRRVMVEGAGHMLNMEQPARFTDLVLVFLRP